MNERLRILGLIESGHIDVEEGLRQLEVLNRTVGARAAPPADSSAASLAGAAEPAFESGRPGFVRIVWKLVFGVGVAVLAGGGLLLARVYGAGGRPGLAWGWVLLTLGLLVMLLGWWLREARWFTLRVCEQDGPTFTLALPLPLGLVIWLLRSAEPFVPQLQEMEVDQLVVAMREELRDGRPWVVNVDDGENGDQVEVHFG